MTNTISFTIDGKKLTTAGGTTILQAALDHGIYIPNLCHHPDLKPVGACRLCMVAIEGRGRVTACTTEATANMIVHTSTAEIEKIRRANVELLLNSHEGDCLNCLKNTKCELQKITNFVGIDSEHLAQYIKPATKFPVDDSNPFFTLNPNKCVLCGLCVRTCHELQCIGAIDFVNRGIATVVAPFAGQKLLDSYCASCGECVVRCPTAALAVKKALPPEYEVKTVCPYCGCGCVYYLGVRGNKLVSARGDRESPANRGSLCVKGRFGFEFVNSKERLTKPLIRKNGELQEASWDEALDLIAQHACKFKGDQFAMLASARCTNEDNYVMQKFTRAVMQANNIDHCARLCHAPTVAGLAQTLGSGAMTNSTQELGDSQCIFAIGTNTTEAHPIIALQIKRAVHNGASLIVANPREIDLCRGAEVFLQHRPGTDVALMMGIARVIVDENLQAQDFIAERSENFAEFVANLKEYPLDKVSNLTGVPEELIKKAARIYATKKPGAILYAMGITQHTHGTDNVIATSNLALLTGNLGIKSAGVNPLRGQNNVQGACDMGALPNVFTGYQKVTDEAARQKFGKAWGVSLNPNPGLTSTEIITAVDEGKIAMLYIAGENPVISEADAHHVEHALGKAKFLVVQDIFLTETAKFAHVVLPATSYAEKDGTFTNTERRVQRVRKAIANIGEAKDDWRIVAEIAQRLDANGFDYKDSEAIMQEIAALTPSYHGITYARLESESLQWPVLDQNHPGTPILHTKSFATSSGKGKFLSLTYRASAELPDDEFPLVLTTDRSLFHYHTATMTRKVAGLNTLRAHEWLEINPEDANALNLVDGEKVKIISRRGEVIAPVKITTKSPVGVVSMTFHFAESPTNVLTNAAVDPVAKIPETKVCAARIEKILNA